MEKPYHYAGWEFADNGREIFLDKHIPNPHPPGLVVSFFSYEKTYPREEAAAWLISHWYEHLLQVCPCINEGDTDNNFRTAFMETLLICHPPVE
jgi:hypothetical protein